MAEQFGAVKKFSSKLDLAQKFLDIYLVIKPPTENLVSRAKEALAYFLAYGYSKDKEKQLENALSKKIKSGYIRVIVNKLKSPFPLSTPPPPPPFSPLSPLYNINKRLIKMI